MLKLLTSGVRAALAVTLGLGAGVVVAQGAARLAFKKATIYDTMVRLHQETGASLAFVNKGGNVPATFDLTSERAPKMIHAAARQFGKEEVKVASIYVLEDALPNAATSRDKIKAAEAFIDSRFPRAPGANNAVDEFASAVQGEAKSMAGALGPGSFDLGSLTPDKRQSVLDLVRAEQYHIPAIWLSSTMTQLQQAEHPQQ